MPLVSFAGIRGSGTVTLLAGDGGLGVRASIADIEAVGSSTSLADADLNNAISKRLGLHHSA